MENKIIWIIILGILLVVAIVSFIVALCNGSMKKFVIEKMEEAEKKFPKGTENYQANRRNYVIQAFKDKYKIGQFILNVKQFIEYIIEVTKQINSNKK